MKTTFQAFANLTASEPITAGIPFSQPELLSSRPSPLLPPKSVLLSRASMRKNFRAFGRVELFATIASLALLGIAVLPALASTKSRSQSAQCLNNLRLMGRAVQIWGSEYSGMPPWRTSVSDGGTRPDSGVKPGVAWYEYSFMSNELVTPRILACPADDGVQVAPDFDVYKSAPYRSDATSYSLFWHAASEFPAGVLFSDRNFRGSAYGGTSCSVARNTSSGTIDATTTPQWTNAVHATYGNIVTMDGTVSETTAAEFRSALLPIYGNDTTHYVKGR